MRKLILSAVLIAASLLCFSCKDDNDDPVNCNNWAVEIQAEADAVSNTAIAWSSDPTNTTKCNAYKNALFAYADALADAEGCANTAGQHAEWQAAIDATNAAANNLQC